MAVALITVELNEAGIDFLLRSPDGPVGRFLAQIAQDVTNLAKQLAPVDTGRLRSSISWTMGLAAGGLFAEVGSNVEYAPYVELGTVYQQAQPYLVPALRAVLDSL